MSNMTQLVLLKLAIEQVLTDPNQPRREFDEKELNELAQSIKNVGQLQPILVFLKSKDPELYQIIAGERRYRACILAGISEISAVVDNERTMSEPDIRTRSIIENYHRQNLNPIEEAQAFERLMKAENLNAKQLSNLLSITEGKISKSLSLLPLDESVQQAVASGQLSASTACEIGRNIDDHEVQEDLANTIIEERLNRDEAKALVNRTKKNRGKLPQKKQPKSKPSMMKVSCTTVSGIKATFSGKELNWRKLNDALIAINSVARSAIEKKLPIQELSALMRETCEESSASKQAAPAPSPQSQPTASNIPQASPVAVPKETR